jgi:hypothetical protein
VLEVGVGLGCESDAAGVGTGLAETLDPSVGPSATGSADVDAVCVCAAVGAGPLNTLDAATTAMSASTRAATVNPRLESSSPLLLRRRHESDQE